MTSQILIADFGMIAADAPEVVVPSIPPPRVGNCVAREGTSFDLGKLLFLKTDSVIVERPLETLRISIKGERVEIEDLRSRQEGAYVTNIAGEVEPKVDLDVELKLAMMTGSLVVYWKETYQHRIYRQGLFRFVNGRPAAVCEGRGGSTSFE